MLKLHWRLSCPLNVRWILVIWRALYHKTVALPSDACHNNSSFLPPCDIIYWRQRCLYSEFYAYLWHMCNGPFAGKPMTTEWPCKTFCFQARDDRSRCFKIHCACPHKNQAFLKFCGVAYSRQTRLYSRFDAPLWFFSNSPSAGKFTLNLNTVTVLI